MRAFVVYLDIYIFVLFPHRVAVVKFLLRSIHTKFHYFWTIQFVDVVVNRSNDKGL